MVVNLLCIKKHSKLLFISINFLKISYPELRLLIKDHFKDTIFFSDYESPSKSDVNSARMLITAFEDEGRYYQLKIVNPMVKKGDLIQRLFYNLIWLYLVLLVAIILINNLALQKLWRPFYSLLHKLQQFRLGSGDPFPSVKTKTKEFRDLQKSIETLLQHNLRSYEQQKQFIGNASHELQTPLAISINKLEILLGNPNLSEKEMMEIGAILDTLGRMTRLNKSLLLLTKIENGQFFNKQTLQLNPILTKGIEDLREIMEFKEVEIVQNINTPLRATMDPALADILVNNLLRNALFHNIKGGTIALETKDRILKVANTSNLPALVPEKVFDRFYKSSNNKNSTGLGLAIIKSICDLYGIEIKYQYKLERHEFCLTFPAY